MGWYGEHNETCPNCGGKRAVTQFYNNMTGPLYLACPDCGLKMHCDGVAYIITNSYIDKNIIGKDPETDDAFSLLDEDVSETTDEQIIKNRTYTATYQG